MVIDKNLLSIIKDMEIKLESINHPELTKELEFIYQGSSIESEMVTLIQNFLIETENKNPDVIKKLLFIEVNRFKRWCTSNNYRLSKLPKYPEFITKSHKQTFWLMLVVGISFTVAGCYKLFNGLVSVGRNLKTELPVYNNGSVWIFIGIACLVGSYYKFRVIKKFKYKISDRT
jgi:hypothetical protein